MEQSRICLHFPKKQRPREETSAHFLDQAPRRKCLFTTVGLFYKKKKKERKEKKKLVLKNNICFWSPLQGKAHNSLVKLSD
jgi:hypothetical protein